MVKEREKRMTRKRRERENAGRKEVNRDGVR